MKPLTENQQQALEELKARYPKAFTQPPTPLSINIHAQLLSAYIGSRTTIKCVLRFWCKQAAYHEAVLRSSYRVDLEGRPADSITNEQRSYHKRKLKKLLAEEQPKPSKPVIRKTAISIKAPLAIERLPKSGQRPILSLKKGPKSASR